MDLESEFGKSGRTKALLGRIGFARGSKIKFVQQMESADCGAACLAMALGIHGRAISLVEARAAAGASRGTDARGILDGAAHHGLRGRGIRIELEEVGLLPRGTILHWDFNHFVVLNHAKKSCVGIVDPSFGPREMSWEEFGKHFTGVALVFEPTEAFVAAAPSRNPVWGYLAHLFNYPSLVARVVVTSVAMRSLALALPVLTGLVVDRVVPRKDQSLLLIVAIGVAIVLSFQVVASLIRSHLLIVLRTKIDTRMTFGFVAHLLALPYSFFTRRSSGDLLLRVGSNTQIRDLLTSSLLSTLLDGALAIGYIVVLLLLSLSLAGATLGIALLQGGAFLLWRKRYSRLASRDLESQARVQSQLVQMFVGIETLKIANAEGRAFEQWANLYVDQLNVSIERSHMMTFVEAINGLLQTAAPLALLGLGAKLVIDGQLSLGTMLAASALATGFLTPVSSLLGSALQLQNLGSHVERLRDVWNTEPEQRRKETIAPPKLTGRLEVKDLSFRYGPKDPFVVRNVSLVIEAGTTVAIVGRSGSGKSTLAALLLGMHTPTEGRIYFDAFDAAELDHQLLRRQLAMVPQAPYIFSGSIRSNIALIDSESSLERVIDASRRACIEQDIRAMTMGFETPVAEGGANLSGGQRQRLALARALLGEPAVILLDEATSSLDATTERLVMTQLNELRATRIVIAHRLSTIASADQILVMEGGRIVEYGRHEEMLQRGGVYAKLVADQTFREAA